MMLELQKLFPEDALDFGVLSPLTWDAVIREFLLPETVLLLLQEDLGMSKSDILKMLRDNLALKV
jgi:hypothetical protein